MLGERKSKDLDLRWKNPKKYWRHTNNDWMEIQILKKYTEDEGYRITYIIWVKMCISFYSNIISDASRIQWIKYRLKYLHLKRKKPRV
jgi:hypothetical protein